MRVQKLLLDVAKVLAVLLLMGLAVWVYLGWQVEPKLPVLGEATYIDSLMPLSEDMEGRWFYEGYPSEVFTLSTEWPRMQITATEPFMLPYWSQKLITATEPFTPTYWVRMEMAATQPFTLTYLGYTQVPTSYLFQPQEADPVSEPLTWGWGQGINEPSPAYENERFAHNTLPPGEVGSYYWFDFEAMGGTWQISSERKPLEDGWPKLRLRSDLPFKVYSRAIDEQVITANLIASVTSIMWVVGYVVVILAMLAYIVKVVTDLRKETQA